MADWELFVGLASAVVAMITWVPWYADALRVNPLVTPRSYRAVLGMMPAACLLLVLLCLENLAAKTVRESSRYALFYLTLGAATLGISARLAGFLGVSARDDVLERRNGASLIAIAGVLLGCTLCFSGGNIGEGPGAEAVFASAGTSLCVWFVLWYLLEVLSGHRVSERITVERDIGAGVRFAGLVTANGIILGVASAGQWVPETFIRDFVASAWPALALTVSASLAERFWGPRSMLGWSLLAVSGYLILASLWAFQLGLG